MLEAIHRLVQIDEQRNQGGRRYWDLSYEGTGEDGQPLKVTRQVSIFEVRSKLQRLAQAVGCQRAAEVVSRWRELSPEQRSAAETIVVAVSRSERPRAVDGHTYSWRLLDHRFFKLVREAEERGQVFAPLPPLADLQQELGVGLRAIQKSIARMRKEAKAAPGLRVHVDFWIGEPPKDYNGPVHPWLWLSRWGTRTPEDADRRGLLPASTKEEAAVSRELIWARLASRD